jgi:hypothetical protein
LVSSSRYYGYVPGLTRRTDSIDRRRQALIHPVIGNLHSLVADLRDGETSCSFECESILLGALMKQMHRESLLWPRPSKPFLGFSFVEIAQTIRSLQSPVWYSTDHEDQSLSKGKPLLHRNKKATGRQTYDLVNGGSDPNGPYTASKSPLTTHRCTFQTKLNPTRLDFLEATTNGLDLEGDLFYSSWVHSLETKEGKVFDNSVVNEVDS